MRNPAEPRGTEPRTLRTVGTEPCRTRWNPVNPAEPLRSVEPGGTFSSGDDCDENIAVDAGRARPRERPERSEHQPAGLRDAVVRHRGLPPASGRRCDEAPGGDADATGRAGHVQDRRRESPRARKPRPPGRDCRAQAPRHRLPLEHPQPAADRGRLSAECRVGGRTRRVLSPRSPGRPRHEADLRRDAGHLRAAGQRVGAADVPCAARFGDRHVPRRSGPRRHRRSALLLRGHAECVQDAVEPRAHEPERRREPRHREGRLHEDRRAAAQQGRRHDQHLLPSQRVGPDRVLGRCELHARRQPAARRVEAAGHAARRGNRKGLRGFRAVRPLHQGAAGRETS